MKRTILFSIVGLAAVSATIAFAQAPKDNKTTGAAPAHGQQPEMQLPPGWTEADMQACAEAATPGKMHAFLAEAAGVWHGKNTMWMAPGMPPMNSECTATISTMMDGRFTKCEMAGDMPGMGPFTGLGINGFDNVAQKFQSTWIDNCGTAMMTGTGELSSDGTTMTWTYNYSCPITRKPVTMREIERRTGKDAMTLEMHGVDPKSGKEFKMMEIVMTRKPGATAAANTN